MNKKTKKKFQEYEGNNPLQFVISKNIERRHLTDSQKAFASLNWLPHFQEEAKKRQLNPSKFSTGNEGIKELVPEGQARDKCGEVFGISGRIIDMAKTIKEKSPEEIKEIWTGKKTVTTVYKDLKIKEQKKEIEELKEITGKYDVIVIDPPWKVKHTYSSEHYMGRVANPYPEMTIAEIRNIKLPAKENCILWLWATHSQIWSAYEIMKNWGFEYKCILVWNKESMGVGKWLRKQCEFCLLGIKGKPPWDATDVRDIISEKRTTHSTKPEIFYKIVDEICAGRKQDYFGRKKREGWDIYGTEIKEEEDEKTNHS